MHIFLQNIEILVKDVKKNYLKQGDKMEENEIDMKRLLYPTVTEIISKQTEREMRSIPLDNLINASIRGQKIDNYCTAHLLGLWNPEIEEEYKPYVDIFIEWANENIYQTLYTKTRLYDDKRRFSGEPDWLCVLKDSKKTALIDLKVTCSVSKTWVIQLSAYKDLLDLHGFNVDVVMNLHLNKKKAAVYEERQGKKVLVSPPVVEANVIEHNNLNPYRQIFSSALICYDYFDRKGKFDPSTMSPCNYKEGK